MRLRKSSSISGFDVVVGAEVATTLRVLVAREARHHGDGQRLGMRIRADEPQDLEAVDLRQHHVEQHERRQRLVLQQRERRLAIARVLDRVARPLEPVRGEVDEVVVVFDDEDATAHRYMIFLVTEAISRPKVAMPDDAQITDKSCASGACGARSP